MQLIKSKGGTAMNSRERLITALQHKEPDRIPFDIGATLITGITKTAYLNLLEYLAMPKEESAFFDIVQQLASPSEAFLSKFGSDVRNVSPNDPSTWKLAIEERGDYWFFKDQWQIGWRMPKKKGFYFDMIEHPLADALDEKDIDSYAFPDADNEARYVGIREKALDIRNRNYGVVMSSIGAGIFEYGGWLRGYENFYADLAGDPDLACKVMDKVLEIKLKYWDRVLSLAGDLIDVVQEADDLGSQNSMLISPKMYRQYLKPRHQELFNFIHRKTKAKIFLHSCGSFREVIPDLIEVGLDIINPVQFNAAHMDSLELKKDFGKDLVFWGGGVDTQKILPKGTVMEVKDCVKRQIEALAPGGGLVFNTVHNIQSDVPPQNIVAMWEALQEYGKY
jgi:uroporphyrinogen decarboxylase